MDMWLVGQTRLTRLARLACAIAAVTAACGGGGGSSDAPPVLDGRLADAGAGADARELSCTGTTVEGTPELALEMVQDGFSNPTLALSPISDPRVFVVQLDGTIHIAGVGQFMDVANVQSGGEQGLLGMAFHPDFGANGRFFLFYTVNGNSLHVDEFTTRAGNPNEGDPDSRVELLSIPHTYSNHNGGMLNFGPDGFLYISTGDGGDGCDPEANAQDPTVLLGKLLRIDVDHQDPGKNYAIPAGNPLGNEVYHLGLRNPWRFSIDSTGDIYIGDVGQGTFEEIDIAPAGMAGLDFGWDTWESHVCHAEGDNGCSNGSFHDTCDETGVTWPVIDVDRANSTAIIGGPVYRGCRMPGYHGTYFYSDHYQGWVRTFKWDGVAATEMTDRPTLTRDDISAYGVDGLGEILIAEYSAGVIWRVVPAR